MSILNTSKYLPIFMVLFSMAAPSTFGMDQPKQVVQGESTKECPICSEDKSLFLECPHCKQIFCKECAERWIGATFIFTTNYLSLQTANHSNAINESCPYCKQKISREDLQKQLSEKDPAVILAEPKTSTELLAAKAMKKGQRFDIQMGTIRGSNVPVVLMDDIKFAVIEDNLIANVIDIDFSGYNLIILSDISANNNLTIKAINTYILGNIVSGANITFKFDERIYCFGTNIHAQGEITLPPEDKRVFGGSYKSARLEFIQEFKEALEIDNLQKLGYLMTLLVTYDGTN